MHAAASLHRPILGIALKLGSVVLFAGMTLCVKLLGQAVPVGQTIFVRGVVSVLLLALIAWHTNQLHLLKTNNIRSHALRSLSGTVSMFCLFTAVTMIPLADVTAISFTSPMFITLLAMVFLGEQIHRFRWTALALGFIGVLIMLGPHLTFADGASLGVLVALSAAMFSAVAMIFLRMMSGGEHALTITFYFSLTFMACAALTALGGWVVPTAMQWLQIILAGLFGVTGQLVMTYSYRYAPASTIAPLDYSNMIMSVLLGYLFFDEIPSASVWIGAPLVVAGGLIILWREYALKKRPSPPTPEPTPQP
ncbi:DMT family transporter [Steroidobacter cummioxidans]|uniref:DMT family transporter n=1 Tax=Steroidobacter cummioxidans TaxID=1803913 RepID=UPI00129011BB|nr:DMT family transporter [Steroidobacter cummioxidans]